MTPVEAFAIIGSAIILTLVTTLRGGDDQDRKSEAADYLTGVIVLTTAWIVSVGIGVLI